MERTIEEYYVSRYGSGFEGFEFLGGRNLGEVLWPPIGVSESSEWVDAVFDVWLEVVCELAIKGYT